MKNLNSKISNILRPFIFFITLCTYLDDLSKNIFLLFFLFLVSKITETSLKTTPTLYLFHMQSLAAFNTQNFDNTVFVKISNMRYLRFSCIVTSKDKLLLFKKHKNSKIINQLSIKAKTVMEISESEVHKN